MKTLLVTGTSSGIGKAIAHYFSNLGMNVITVSRSGTPTYQGDITNAEFRNFLYENVNPDILINCAGIVSKNINDMFAVNTAATSDLMMNYYNIMGAGSHIITISSIAATMSENLFVPNSIEFNAYASSKKAVSDLSLALSKNRQRDVRVTVIEPNDVRPTNLIHSRTIPVNEDAYLNFNFNNITPMTSDYIAEVCDWVLKQPKWVNVSKVILENNFLR